MAILKLIVRSGFRAKPKELLLYSSLSGEPCYASILWADDHPPKFSGLYLWGVD